MKPFDARGRAVALAVTGAVAALAAVAAAWGSGTAATDFRLVFDGRHTPSFWHEGTFTSSAAYCPSGTAADVDVDSTDTATRVFTCAGSGDTFTVKVTPLPAEHGGSGGWQIVSGTGTLAELRGKGTWTSVRLGGSANDPLTITFRNTADGVADFDTAAPVISVPKASAKRLKGPRRTYLVRLRLAFDEAAGNAVSYGVAVRDPRNANEITRVGKTSSGGVSLALRIRPAKRTRFLTVRVQAGDPVGNAATRSTRLRLR